MTRSESREQALKIVFQQTFSPELTVGEIAELNAEADDVQTDDFARELAGKVRENTAMLDGIISSKLVKWTLDRIPRITVCILRLAVAEIVFREDTPVSVVANEAVELTKKYVGEKESGFVNGVLGAVIKDKSNKAAEETQTPAEQTAAAEETDK